MIRSDMALLEVEGLTVRRGTRTILDNLQLSVDSGECVSSQAKMVRANQPD